MQNFLTAVVPAIAAHHSDGMTGDGRPDLVFIKTKNVGSGHVEVHVATAGSGFQQTGGDWASWFSPGDADNGTWTMAPITLVRVRPMELSQPYARKIYCVKTANTGSGRVELYILDASTAYQQLTIHATTAIDVSHAGDYEFGIANFVGEARDDLVTVRRRNTATGRVEVHEWSEGSNSDYSAELPFTTALDEAEESNYIFLFGHFGNFDETSRPDLFCLKKANTASGQLEVHVLSAASNYIAYSLHAVTPVSLIDIDEYDFAIGNYLQSLGTDLFLLKKRNCASGKLEVHVLAWTPSAQTAYQQFSLHTPTPLDSADADANFRFAMASPTFDEAGSVIAAYSNLICIKTANTATQSVEVHDVARFDDYNNYAFRGPTAIEATDVVNFRLVTRVPSIDFSAPNTLPDDQFLYPGMQLTAANEPFKAIMQKDGNFVVYRTDIEQPLWATGTNGKSVLRAVCAGGSLVLQDQFGSTVWTSGSPTVHGSYLVMQDDGNLVIYTPQGTPNWQSKSYGSTVLPSKPCIVSDGSRCDAFQQGFDGSVLHNTSNGSWTGWVSLGGSTNSAPAAVSWASGRLDVFARGTDSSLMHKWLEGNTWSEWESLGGVLLSAPSVASSAPGSLDVFVCGPDNAIWRLSFSGGAWHQWESVGGVTVSAPVAISGTIGTIDLFARGVDHVLWHRLLEGSSWQGWEYFGGSLKGDMGAARQGGTTYITALLEGQAVGYRSSTNGGWSGWQTSAVQAKPQGLMGSQFCDQQYADCMGNADKIEDDVARVAKFAACVAQQIACYAEYAAMTVIQWVEGVLGPVLTWISNNVGIILAIVTVAAAVVIAIVCPPAGPAVLSVFVLAL